MWFCKSVCKFCSFNFLWSHYVTETEWLTVLTRWKEIIVTHDHKKPLCRQQLWELQDRFSIQRYEVGVAFFDLRCKNKKELQKLKQSICDNKCHYVSEMLKKKNPKPHQDWWNCEHCNKSWPMIWRQQCGPSLLDCWCEGVYSLLPIKRLLCSACVRLCVWEQSQGQSLGFTLLFDILHLPAVLLSIEHTVVYWFYMTMTRVFKTGV